MMPTHLFHDIAKEVYKFLQATRVQIDGFPEEKKYWHF